MATVPWQKKKKKKQETEDAFLQRGTGRRGHDSLPLFAVSVKWADMMRQTCANIIEQRACWETLLSFFFLSLNKRWIIYLCVRRTFYILYVPSVSSQKWQIQAAWFHHIELHSAELQQQQADNKLQAFKWVIWALIDSVGCKTEFILTDHPLCCVMLRCLHTTNLTGLSHLHTLFNKLLRKCILKAVKHVEGDALNSHLKHSKDS